MLGKQPFETRYRIVFCNYYSDHTGRKLGYAIERKVWWWPGWHRPLPAQNRHQTLEQAKQWLQGYAGVVVEWL